MSELISLIVSVYNEEKGLRQFYDTTKKILEGMRAGNYPALKRTYDYEICFVNDGSTDGSGRLLQELKNADQKHVTVVTFSKNFGHEAAMTAGLDYASGHRLIFMDADLQHPPELIPEIAKRFEEGFEIVSMARTKN